jgi:hypothetical protein
MNTYQKPTWITLYIIGMIGGGAAFCVPLLHMPPVMNTIMYLLIIFTLFGVIGMWVSATSGVFEADEMADMKIKFKIHWDVARQTEKPKALPSSTEKL